MMHGQQNVKFHYEWSTCFPSEIEHGWWIYVSKTDVFFDAAPCILVQIYWNFVKSTAFKFKEEHQVPFPHWKWKQDIIPNHTSMSTRLHDHTFRNAVMFIITAWARIAWSV